MISSQRHSRAFTMIEALIVVALIAILMLMAVPLYTDKIVRDQITESMKLIKAVQEVVATKYKNSPTAEFPIDNAAAGLPPADKIVNNFVSSITVTDGVINVVYGNNSGAVIQGKKLTFRPLVPSSQQFPVDWLCNNKPVPAGAQVKGTNVTDIPYAFLPFDCRGPAPQQ